jgi:hypothetical protein
VTRVVTGSACSCGAPPLQPAAEAMRRLEGSGIVRLRLLEEGGQLLDRGGLCRVRRWVRAQEGARRRLLPLGEERQRRRGIGLETGSELIH